MSKIPDRSLWGVFGGSFDPPHSGHVALIRNLIAMTPLAGVCVVPSCNHPLKQNVATASYDDRLAMARLAYAECDNIIVSDIEQRLGLSGYTIDTIQALKQEFPDRSLAFIIGADLLHQFQSWHRPNDILQEAILIVGQRPGHHLTIPTGIPVESIRFIDTELNDISSSEIRNVIHTSGTGAIEGLVPVAVRQYIVSHRLYL